MLRAINYALPRDAPVAAEKARPFQRPGWAGNHIGFYPFPTIADEMREEHRRRVLGE
jgi:hypothetical protein